MKSISFLRKERSFFVSCIFFWKRFQVSDLDIMSEYTYLSDFLQIKNWCQETIIALSSKAKKNRKIFDTPRLFIIEAWKTRNLLSQTELAALMTACDQNNFSKEIDYWHGILNDKDDLIFSLKSILAKSLIVYHTKFELKLTFKALWNNRQQPSPLLHSIGI